MSGFPRDLAVLEPWELSLHRSLERRQKTARGRTRAAGPPRAVLGCLLAGILTKGFAIDTIYDNSTPNPLSVRRS